VTAGEIESTAHSCPTCGKDVAADAKVCPHDGTILSWSTVDPLIGTLLLDKYQISDVLGRGGMSAVYKARHLLMDRFVAIKVLRAELVTDPQSLRRFQLESRAVSVLKHPNVMTVHDFGLTPDGIPYLIMDYLEGKTISEILREEGHLQPERCVQLLHQACVALAHAHSKGVIHRDIKPSNLIVVIDEDGTEVLKIVDFGIAKLLQTEGSMANLTTTGEVFGSPAYMSPEQCVGTRADARSDIYGLGCVVYECLMGTSPIRGQTAMETCMKQINEMPKAFRVVRPDLKLSANLEAAVMKALAKNPDERYQSMTEFDQGLKSAVGPDVVIELKSDTVDAEKTKEASFLDGDITETIVTKNANDTSGNTTKTVVNEAKEGKGKGKGKAKGKKSSVASSPDQQSSTPESNDKAITPAVAASAASTADNARASSSAERTGLPDTGSAQSSTDLPDTGSAQSSADLPDTGSAQSSTDSVQSSADLPDTGSAQSSDRGDTGTQSKDRLTNQLSDSRTRIPPLAVPSFDLFGNQLLPAAPDQVSITDTTNTTTDRSAAYDAAGTMGTTGTMGNALIGDDKFLPSILPAAPDPVSSLPNSGAAPYESGSDRGPAPHLVSKAEAEAKVPVVNKSTKSEVVKTTGAGSKASLITYLIGGLAIVTVVGFLGYKAIESQHSSAGDPNADKTKEASTAGGAVLTPTEIFKTCGPSIVTLTIVTKALAVAVEGMELTDLTGDDPILACPTGDEGVSLFDKGKPVKIAIGKLKTSKGTIPVAVKLADSHPVLILISEKGEPLLKDGKPIIISKGVGFKSYTSESIGSGFYVRPDIVATNCHVVSEGPLGAAGFAGGLAQVTDKPGKYTITEKPITIDKDHDLALLYVPGAEAKPMNLRSDYSGLKVGETVFALGSPKGLAGSLSEGLISSDKLRGVNPKDPDSPKLYLQHSAKIDHGNSGGPLVDAEGRVIGINTAGMGNGAINLAVVVQFVDDLLNKPEVKAKIEEFAKNAQTDLHG
jgi:serine/threonine protein kinase/S1-C subfamily serine protease